MTTGNSQEVTAKKIGIPLSVGRKASKPGVYISRIEGSFYTVMGLPLHLVYQKLSELGYKRKKAKSIDG